ncbi:hypothetical protein VARIO8X_60358 [Burkholderiales bacterium 8X]|nr:hypothetical protein VARIO8X_60358 [Burkholderiales bacterium 8X]
MTASRSFEVHPQDPIEEAERAIREAQDAIVREFAASLHGAGDGPRSMLLIDFASAVGWRCLLARDPDPATQAELSLLFSQLRTRIEIGECKKAAHPGSRTS